MSLPVRSFQRAYNRANLLHQIRTKGLISRIDLARSTGLSQASVTTMIAELRDEGLIVEKKSGPYEGGRRPVLLGINADGIHVIGVNISIGQIRVVVINFLSEVVGTYTCLLDKAFYQPEDLAHKIVRAVQACMWESNFSKDQISGVGIGIPGLVDSASGVIKFLPNYGWEDVPFRDMLQKEMNHPVYIDNSSNNLAIAEYWWGSGKGVDNFLVVTLENGVGAGSVVNGQLMRGHQGIASEFGHLCIDPNGPLCRCGRRGCIETYSGNNGIIREAKKLIGQGKWNTQDVSAGKLVFKDVLEELQTGNEELIALYEKAGEVLGIGVSNLITLFNPELLIITGKGVMAGDALFDSMYRKIEELKSDKYGYFNAEIIVQTWTDGDWARESGTLVLREIYKSPVMK